MTRNNPFELDLDRNPANYAPLSPLSLIARAAYTYPKHLAVVHGERRYTWAETYARCRRFASALAKAGIGVGDTVALMAANTREFRVTGPWDDPKVERVERNTAGEATADSAPTAEPAPAVTR